MSESIKNMLNNTSNSRAAAGDVVPVAEVDGKTLSKLMEWCRKHTEDVEEEEAEEVIKEWDGKFIGELDQRMLYKLVTATYRLKVGELEELLIQRTADLLADFAEHRGFTIEQLDSIFRDDNAWAWSFDDY